MNAKLHGVGGPFLKSQFDPSNIELILRTPTHAPKGGAHEPGGVQPAHEGIERPAERRSESWCRDGAANLRIAAATALL